MFELQTLQKQRVQPSSNKQEVEERTQVDPKLLRVNSPSAQTRSVDVGWTAQVWLILHESE